MKIYPYREAKNFTIQISNFSVRCLINYLEKYKLLNKNIDKDIVANLCKYCI